MFESKKRAPEKWGQWLLLAALLVSCGAENTVSDTSDSNSNWLKSCDDESQCDPEQSCVNRLCVTDCDDGGDCEGTASMCLEASTVGECVVLGSGTGQCFVPCDGNSDCQSLGDAFSCIAGVCLNQDEDCGEEPSEPSPEPDVNPEPAGEPSPEPDVNPEPAGEPSPEPATPEPSSEPTDTPEPSPEPTDTPEPSPEPTGTPEPAPEATNTPEPEPADVECPAAASSCPEGCAPIQSSPADEGRLCFGAPETLGCVPEGQEATSDDNCIRRVDGTVYPGVSGTHVAILVASGEFEACSAEDEELISNAVGTCAPLPFQYSTQITNGIDCCDYYTVVRSDRDVDSCIAVEFWQPVNGDPMEFTARAVRGAEDCWASLLATDPGATDDLTGPANGVTGTASVTYDGGAQLTFYLVIDFTDGPALVPPEVVFSFEQLPVDGTWYDGF